LALNLENALHDNKLSIFLYLFLNFIKALEIEHDC